MIGKRFTRLVVIAIDSPKTWLCQCDCGATKNVATKHLLGGNVKSCGCFRREFRRNKRHGRETLYTRWNGMRQRCENPNATAYPRYGGRGIRVCPEWLDFDQFLADMGEPSDPKLTIERIDSDGDYRPDNCRWASRLEQSQNISSNRNITYRGRTLSLSAWARETGIGMKTLQYRIDSGWPEEKVFTPPAPRKTRK